MPSCPACGSKDLTGSHSLGERTSAFDTEWFDTLEHAWRCNRPRCHKTWETWEPDRTHPLRNFEGWTVDFLKNQPVEDVVDAARLWGIATSRSFSSLIAEMVRWADTDWESPMLEALSNRQLRRIAHDCDVTTTGLSRDELIAAILGA